MTNTLTRQQMAQQATDAGWGRIQAGNVDVFYAPGQTPVVAEWIRTTLSVLWLDGESQDGRDFDAVRMEYVFDLRLAREGA